MHLLYLDESGSVGDPTQQFFVLAGVSVFERTTHWVEDSLNQIAARFAPADPYSIELHGSPMRGGSDGWRNFPAADRRQAMVDALQVGVAGQSRQSVRLFGVAVRKAALAGRDPVEYAFEELARRFDIYLMRLYRRQNDAQRGIMLFDKSSTEYRLQALARDFKHNGHRIGQTRNYAEVPVFLDSRASRLIQLADLVAYAMFRHYEHQDSTYFNVIRQCFDSEGGVVHGLHEVV